MRSGRVALAVLAATLVAACSTGPAGVGSGSGSPGSTAVGAPAATATTLQAPTPPPIDLSTVPGNVHVDAAMGTSAWIGPAGGTVATTAADGTTYQLALPPLALENPTPITISAIASIDKLGLSGGLAGAVYLGPKGTQLLEPASLTITTSKTAPPGEALVGFDVADDGSTQLVPATADGHTVTVLVFHFSAPGAGFGTSQDLEALGPSTSSPLAVELRFAHGFSELLTEPTPWSEATSAVALAFINVVWNSDIQPGMTNVHDDGTLLDDLSTWREFVLLMNLYAHRGDIRAAIADGLSLSSGAGGLLTTLFTAGEGLVGQRISDALTGNKTLCSQSHDLGALANVWFWAKIGQRFAPDQTEWLDAARGCADLDLDRVNLPATIEAGMADAVTMQFVMAFEDGTKTNVDVQETLTGTGFTFGRTGGPTASAGVVAGTTLHEDVLTQANPPYDLAIHACWSFGGVVRALCEDFGRQFPATATQAAPTPTPTGTPSGIDFSSLAGTYQVTLICENATYGTGTGHVTVAGTNLSMSWSVTITEPADGSGDCDTAAKQHAFPTMGTFGGTVALAAGGIAAVTINQWQVSPCLSAAPETPTGAGFRGAAVGIPIANCVPSSLFGQLGYQGTRTGP